MLKNLINLLFPLICNGCKSLLLKNENTICSNCRHDLPETFHHKIENNETFTKFYGLIPLEFACSYLYFNKDGIVQEMIHNLKYRNQQEIGTLLGSLYANDLKELVNFHGVDEIIPVPLHSKRLKERGYNQVTTFCNALAKNLNISVNENLLIRTKYTETQTKKDREHRQYKNLNLFDIQNIENHTGKHFLLVDDVITTGATLEKCALALLKIPNSKVSIVTIAYTLS